MTIEEKMTRDWLTANPYDPACLPAGWEEKFGLRGRFMKYESVEHAERKNTHGGVPFGGANYMWEELKANMLAGDELWLVGTDGSVVVYLIRDGSVVWEQFGPRRGCRRGYCVYLVIT